MFAKQLLAFGAFLGLVAAALACKCIPLSEVPAVDKCPDHFLSIFKIDNIEHRPKFFKYHYQVVADLTPRTAQNGSMTGWKDIGLWTADDSAACGIPLELGSTYLIFGYFHSYPKSQFFPGASFPSFDSCGSVVYKFDNGFTIEEANKELEKVYQDRCVAKH